MADRWPAARPGAERAGLHMEKFARLAAGGPADWAAVDSGSAAEAIADGRCIELDAAGAGTRVQLVEAASGGGVLDAGSVGADVEREAVAARGGVQMGRYEAMAGDVGAAAAKVGKGRNGRPVGGVEGEGFGGRMGRAVRRLISAMTALVVCCVIVFFMLRVLAAKGML